MKMSTPEMTRLWKKKMNQTRLGNRRTMIIHQKRSRMRSKGLKLITPLWILMKKKLSVRIKTLSTLVKVLIILLNRIKLMKLIISLIFSQYIGADQTEILLDLS